jgi:hypothetical protein
MSAVLGSSGSTKHLTLASEVSVTAGWAANAASAYSRRGTLCLQSEAAALLRNLREGQPL